MTRALVFSAGGAAGVAWQIGILRGIGDADPALLTAMRAPGTRFIGTSAGAVVASQFAGGVPIDELFDLRFAEDAGVGTGLDVTRLVDVASRLLQGASGGGDLRARAADLVRGGFAADDVDRRAVFARDLPVTEWPDADLLIAAVEVESEGLHVFDRHDGSPLVDAVAASCAVPLVWPAIEIAGRRYVDGGVHSSTNLELARGCDRVAVLLASGGAPPVVPGASVFAIAADDESLRARAGGSLRASTHAASSAAGRAQGARLAHELREFWQLAD